MNSPISMPETGPAKVGFAPLTFEASLLIDGVGPGFVRIGPHVLRGPVLISPWGAQGWGGVQDTATPLSLQGRIDVLLFGGGRDIARAPAAFRHAIEAAGIGLDPMSTASAARAFNLLITEGRRVALVALPVAGA